MLILGACFGGCLGAGRAMLQVDTDRARFLEAARHGDVKEALATLTQHPELATSTTLLQRKTALHLSAEQGHLGVMHTIVETLLCQASLTQGDTVKLIKELINCRDSEGRTPLVIACGHGHVPCARFLLGNGAFRETVDVRGNTALHYASAKGHLGILFLLLTEYLEELSEEQAVARQVPVVVPNFATTSFAATLANLASGHPVNVSGSIHEDAQVPSAARTTPNPARPTPAPTSAPGGATMGMQRDTSPPNTSPRASNSGLVTLAREDNSSPVISLLPPDVPRVVNARNGSGFTSLHYSAWSRHSGATQLLLQHGADILAKNLRPGVEGSIPCPGGSTALHLSAMRGHIEISRTILKTYWERVLEPMQLQAAGTGQTPAAVQRSLSAVDPRSQVNALGHMPYQVSQRVGYVTLAMLLRPNIPLQRLFSDEERATRFYGPKALKLIAAEALNRKLLSDLSRVAADAAHPLIPTDSSDAPPAASSVPPLPSSPMAPPTSAAMDRAPGPGLVGAGSGAGSGAGPEAGQDGSGGGGGGGLTLVSRAGPLAATSTMLLYLPTVCEADEDGPLSTASLGGVATRSPNINELGPHVADSPGSSALVQVGEQKACTPSADLAAPLLPETQSSPAYVRHSLPTSWLENGSPGEAPGVRGASGVYSAFGEVGLGAAQQLEASAGQLVPEAGPGEGFSSRTGTAGGESMSTPRLVPLESPGASPAEMDISPGAQRVRSRSKSSSGSMAPSPFAVVTSRFTAVSPEFPISVPVPQPPTLPGQTMISPAGGGGAGGTPPATSLDPHAPPRQPRQQVSRTTSVPVSPLQSPFQSPSRVGSRGMPLTHASSFANIRPYDAGTGMPQGVVMLQHGNSVTLTGSVAVQAAILANQLLTHSFVVGELASRVQDKSTPSRRMSGCIPGSYGAAALAAATAGADHTECLLRGPEDMDEMAITAGHSPRAQTQNSGLLSAISTALTRAGSLHTNWANNPAQRSSGGRISGSGSAAQELVSMSHPSVPVTPGNRSIRRSTVDHLLSEAGLTGDSFTGQSTARASVETTLHCTTLGQTVEDLADLPTLPGESPVPSLAMQTVAVARLSSAAPSGLVIPQRDINEGYDDEECGVCMEELALVLIRPCNHTMCGPCALKMCSLNVQRAPNCPFCRATISDFLGVESKVSAA